MVKDRLSELKRHQNERGDNNQKVTIGIENVSIN
jgi:hypothetical protein